jgi:hypothetical protein
MLCGLLQDNYNQISFDTARWSTDYYAEAGGAVRNTNTSEHIFECNLDFLSGRQMVQSLERTYYSDRQFFPTHSSTLGMSLSPQYISISGCRRRSVLDRYGG